MTGTSSYIPVYKVYKFASPGRVFARSRVSCVDGIKIVLTAALAHMRLDDPQSPEVSLPSPNRCTKAAGDRFVSNDVFILPSMPAASGFIAWSVAYSRSKHVYLQCCHREFIACRASLRCKVSWA